MEPAIADYLDLSALRVAFRDVETLVFVSSDGETHRLLHHHRNVVRAAADCGVGHVVVLSSLDADLDSPFCYAVTNRQTELLLEAGGFATSVARASIFTEFFLRWVGTAVTTGEIRLPAGSGRISLVSRDDVGRVLAALATGAPTGRCHAVTGPEAFDLAAIADLTGHATGATIRYVDLDPADFVRELAQEGLDSWWMYAFSSMFASVREQRWAAGSDEVAALTGQPATPLAELLSRRFGSPAGR